MKFEDLILESFYKDEDSESVSLNEDILPITPFLAYASFKKNTFGVLKDKMYDLKTKVGSWALGKKSDALIAKEKARASIGKTTGKGDDATVYKLTKAQMNIMSDIYNRHGNKIIKDIMQFRKNVLAPYSLIKRKVKEATRVTNKDKFGMTKAEFKAYLESGRKKIENRGEKFEKRSEELREKIDRINSQLGMLDEAKSKMEQGEIPRSILNRLYKEYSVHDADLLGYTPEELRSAHNQAEKDLKDLDDLVDKIEKEGASPENVERVINRATREVKPVKKTDDKEEETKKRGSFNLALGRYMFRKEILDKLKDADFNIYKNSYTNIVNNMRKALIENKRGFIRKLSSINDTVKLNDKESLIWKNRATASKWSSDLQDFYQNIEEEDFLDAPIYIERTPELKKAEQEIENEIKRFERNLEKKIGRKDFNKLKQYRLINNLITIRELKSTKDLFKDTNELMQTTNTTREDLEKTEEYTSPEDFERRIWSIHNYSFSSVTELNNARKEVEDLVRKMKEQGEDSALKKMESIVERIRIRRTLSPMKTSYEGRRTTYIIDINDITKKAQEIIDKKYDNVYEQKRDKEKLDNMIKAFKESEGTEAENEISKISFLLNKVERRMSW